MESLLQDVTAVILAGGRSTRFGSDKSRATWRGRSLVDHVLDRLPAERAGTVLVVRQEQDLEPRPGLTTVHDDPQLNDGPLRGLIAGLTACDSKWAWVVACDQPLISGDLLSALLGSAKPDDSALIPEWNGRLQPLTGLYAVETGPLLAECAAAGEQSLIGTLKKIGFRIFDEDECRRHDLRGAGFLNINRPEHLAQLEGFET